MAKAYFLNAQDNKEAQNMSIKVNAGPSHVLGGLFSTPYGQTMSVPFQASVAMDALGVSGENIIAVTTPQNSPLATWSVAIDGEIITVGEDVQFIVLDNELIARQGSIDKGFTITRTG